jgi:ligand-binding sensor domain-containing protein
VKKLFFILFFLFLASCSGQGKKTSAKISFSTKQLITGSNDEIILYVINKDKNEQRAFILTDMSVNMDLDFGSWEFIVVGWEGSNAINQNLICGRAVKIFNQVTDSLSIQVNSSNCNQNFFASSSYRVGNTIKPINFHNCNNLAAVNLTPSEAWDPCQGQSRGAVGSYRLSFVGHPAMGKNLLPTITEANGIRLSSNCISAFAAPSGYTQTDLRVPTGSLEFTPPTLVEVYSNNNCTGESEGYFYPYGFAGLAQERSSIISSSLQTEVLVEWGSLMIIGESSFGNVSINTSSSKTFTLINYSDASANNIQIQAGNSFSISNNNCSSLGKNQSCSFSVNFIPTLIQVYNQPIVVNFLTNNSTRSVNYQVSGSGVNAGTVTGGGAVGGGVAPVVSNLNPAGVLEDVPYTITLPYTHSQNLLAQYCNLQNINNTFIKTPCTCISGVCSVTIQSPPDNNHSASFEYSVVVNGTSSNVGLVSYTYQAVDDAPSVSTISYQPLTSNLTFQLPWFDIEGHQPSSCNIKDKMTFNNVGNCTCASGVCQITLGPTGSAPFDSYLYTVTANGLTSNVGNMVMQTEYPNYFLSLPLNFQGHGSIGSNFVNKVLYHSGILYVATNSGLSISSDQGKNFRTIKYEQGLISSIIKDIVVANGFVYVATNNGLSVASLATMSFISLSALQNLDINSLHVSSAGQVFAGTSSGVFVSNIPTAGQMPTTFTQIVTGLSPVMVKSIVVDSTGSIWAATDGGGLYKKSSSSPNFSAIVGLPNPINSLTYDSTNNKIYVSTTSGVYSGLANSTSFAIFYSQAARQVKISGAHVLIAQDNGYIYSTDGGISYSSGYTGLIQPQVNSIEMFNQNIFTATNMGLGVQYQLNSPVHFFMSALQPSNGVSALFDQDIFVATTNGVAISKNGGRSFSLHTHGLPALHVTKIHASNPSFILAGTNSGLAKSYDGGMTFQTTLSGHSIRAITQASDGTIYVGTTSNLFKSSDWGTSFYSLFDNLSSYPSVNEIYASSSNDLYVATSSGLYISINQGASFISALSGQDVKAVTVSGGMIIAATNSGIHSAPVGTSTFNNINPSTGVLGMTVSQQGVIYVSTSTGVLVSTNQALSFHNLSSIDGLPSIGISGAVSVSHSGVVYVPHNNGVSVSLANSYLDWVNGSSFPLTSFNLGTYPINQTFFPAVFIKSYGNIGINLNSIDYNFNSGFQIFPTAVCSFLIPGNTCALNIQLFENVPVYRSGVATFNINQGPVPAGAIYRYLKNNLYLQYSFY